MAIFGDKHYSMGMTLIEKILAAHSGRDVVRPGDILDVGIDARAARDFGGANVVKHLKDNGKDIADPDRTFFTFDCNPTGSDQRYATNQHICRTYARENDIKVFDIDSGIGTHILMEEGLVWPGATAVSTDSHANIMGAIGAFGQGMGDKDIAVAWHKGSTWFKVPESVKIELSGKLKEGIHAKELILNILDRFGASELLACSVEICGEVADGLSLDQRITIASMATELGAISIMLEPNREVIRYCESRAGRKLEKVSADPDAEYKRVIQVDVSEFQARVALPGKPHLTALLPLERVWIDSAFIGSCTNGRMEDMRAAAAILEGRTIAAHVVLKIVPATDRIWQKCMEEGLLEIFKHSGALISNAGCAGCAAGQVGQNGPGEVTISTGNRNFPGKQGKGDVYLASPAVVASSAIAGYICRPEDLPEKPEPRSFAHAERVKGGSADAESSKTEKPVEVEGRIWYIPISDIDTDMIFHNSHLSITRIEEMGQHAFGNLEGYKDFASKVKEGDIILTGKNFGAGSSRQQAVDCFSALGVSCVLAESFGAIYERNAINAAFPILSAENYSALKAEDGDRLRVNFETGLIENLDKKTSLQTAPFSEVQMEIYQNNGLF